MLPVPDGDARCAAGRAGDAIGLAGVEGEQWADAHGHAEHVGDHQPDDAAGHDSRSREADSADRTDGESAGDTRRAAGTWNARGAVDSRYAANAGGSGAGSGEGAHRRARSAGDEVCDAGDACSAGGSGNARGSGCACCAGNAWDARDACDAGATRRPDRGRGLEQHVTEGSGANEGIGELRPADHLLQAAGVGRASADCLSNTARVSGAAAASASGSTCRAFVAEAAFRAEDTGVELNGERSTCASRGPGCAGWSDASSSSCAWVC